MTRALITIVILSAVAATAMAEMPMVGTAVHAGTDAINVGEPIVGTSEMAGSYHMTHGHVQGIIEVAPSSSTENPGIDNSGILVYPNPVKAILNVDRAGEASESTLTLYANSGTVCLKKHLTEAHETIDATALPAGIYILTIDNGSETLFSTKIIKH